MAKKSNAVSGVLQTLIQGGGFLRDEQFFRSKPGDVWVPSGLIREHDLIDGAVIKGTASQGKKGIQVDSIDSICGLTPELFRARTRFDRLTAINPDERIRLGDKGNVSMRIIELIAPVGKGTRGMIVAPPKSGKTRLLEELAEAINAAEPDIRILILLIDERPEEVTHFRRNVNAEVLASSSDQDIESHIQLTELALAHIRSELECSRDIVVLIDSLTRMSRAFNRSARTSSRTLTGGLDARALEIPRRFFGLARNIENGGSVTVVATAMVDTGSRMDDYIFEEFKGTGNSETVLDRSLADVRVFPAINIMASGTRREELLYSKEEMEGLAKLRRMLADKEPKAAMQIMLGLIEKETTNEKLLQRLRT